MGFIFGIINIDKTSVKEKDVYTLGHAVKWDRLDKKIDGLSIPSVDGLATTEYVDGKVSDLIGGADEAYNTLKKLEDELKDGWVVRKTCDDLKMTTPLRTIN